MISITERALRTAIIAWDEKFKAGEGEIFKLSAEEAVEELKRQGVDERTIVRRNK